MTARRTAGLSQPAGTLVVDEADYLGSVSSQQAQGTRQLEAGFRLLLTATPFKRPGQIPYVLSMISSDPRFRSARAFTQAFPVTSPEALNALFLLMQQ